MPYRVASFAKSIESARERLASQQIPEANRQAIADFTDHCLSDGLSEKRILKYLSTLSNIARRFPVEFNDATRKHVEDLVRDIERADYSDWTKRDFRIALKKFFRWLRGTEEYPPEVKWLRSTLRNRRAKLPDELLTQDEVRRLIAAAGNARDRAMVAMLYESGCRIGELLSLRIKDLQRHPHGFQVTVKGSKGSRRILLVSCVPYLTAWLNEHPRGQDGEHALWATSDWRAAQISYGRVRVVIRAIARRAGITKSVNPHNFRHTRATHLANHLTEAQMKAYLGWVQGSDMPSIYVHLSGRDVDNALLRTYGIAVEDGDSRTSALAPRVCGRCNERNPPTNAFCFRCGAVLDERAAQELRKSDIERSEADRIMDRLIQNRDFRTLLERKLKNLRRGDSHA